MAAAKVGTETQTQRAAGALSAKTVRRAAPIQRPVSSEVAVIISIVAGIERTLENTDMEAPRTCCSRYSVHYTHRFGDV